MKITIEGEPKEIAALVLAVQERQGSGLNEEDILFVKTSDACPEQYDAANIKTGEKIAYLRLRHGIFEIYCPDESAADAMYSFRYAHEIGSFPDDEERSVRLRKAKKIIAAWYRSLQ